ncbi:hydroxyacylglutathione hydrolase [Dongia soli]|uniref:Hydroxyacylglutathione hydrolase n=1 Tax=Dongia soli TaxID=600628 RepID=A0ABU5E5B9_9PROT|nr:hydroxyacylglutathione hydrolase [Dongia soli]MDY0881366.1 hydroxyacylglutathione hydrolase [Dongia soli]
MPTADNKTALEIVQIPVLSDNYVYLAHDPSSGATAVVDPAVAGPVLEAAGRRGWQITHILNTHHHGDHVGGNLEIKRATGAKVIGPAYDRARIPGLDEAVDEASGADFAGHHAQVFFVPGHTSGHIAYYFADSQALFCGDTLFSIGCGRLFEGTPQQMWSSLLKLRGLPAQTRVYCAHEYTESNCRFAMTVEPDNADLARRAAEVKEARAAGRPTVPSTLDLERRCNPFLRADEKSLMQRFAAVGKEPAAIFGAIRAAKDSF